MADTEETIEDIEGTAGEEEALEAGGPKRKLLGPRMIRMLLFVAGALVLIVISGTIAYVVAKKVGTPPAPDKESPQQKVKQKPLSYFGLESFSVNTSDTDEPHFLKVTLQLGYEQGTTNELQTELNSRRAQLRDIIISVLGSKRYNDLNTQDKRNDLKEEIKRKINDVLINGEVHQVAFTEFVLT